MNIHELNMLHLLHVFGVLVLVAFTFFAFAGAPETRKRVIMITGIASLVVLLTGIRMWQGLFSFNAMGWVIVKLVCWLGLSAFTGMAYRRREIAGTLKLVILLLAFVAVVMVYYKPF